AAAAPSWTSHSEARTARAPARRNSLARLSTPSPDERRPRFVLHAESATRSARNARAASSEAGKKAGSSPGPGGERQRPHAERSLSSARPWEERRTNRARSRALPGPSAPRFASGPRQRVLSFSGTSPATVVASARLLGRGRRFRASAASTAEGLE